MMKSKKFAITLYLLGSFLFCLFFFLVYQSVRNDSSVLSIMKESGFKFYTPTATFIPPPTIFDVNFIYMIYLSWILFTVVCIIHLFKVGQFNLKKIHHFSMFFGLAFFIVLMFLSFINQMNFFYASYRLFSEKTLPEKNEILFLNSYRLPDAITQNFPGRYRAELITDLDVTKDPGMFIHRTIAYFLYPIDIRGIRSTEPVEALIVMEKDNPFDAIADDYSNRYKFEDLGIIAFKEGHARSFSVK